MLHVGGQRGDRLLLTGPLTSTLQLFAAVHALAIGALVTDDAAIANAAVCVPARLDAVVAASPQLRSVVVAGAKPSMARSWMPSLMRRMT